MIGGRRVIGVIPARAGSERLPGKNTRRMAGKPMIQWTLDAALASAVLDAIVVTSDDDGVLSLAGEAGVMTVRRPDFLAGSTASVIDAVEHALKQIGGVWDYVVLLQPTSPLRIAADIDDAVRLCDTTGAPAVLGVSKLAKPADFHDRLNGRGEMQGAPDLESVVLINGAVYVGRPERLFSERTFRCSGALGSVMPAERSWDVDSLAEFLACEACLMLTDRGIL